MKIGDMGIGEIWWFTNPEMFPQPKDKFNLCLGGCQFLTINTEDIYGKFPIRASEYTFLKYDSYISHYISDLSFHAESDIPDDHFKDNLSRNTATMLILHINASRVLNSGHKYTIATALQTLL